MKSKFGIAALVAATALPMIGLAPANAEYYSAPAYNNGYFETHYDRAYYDRSADGRSYYGRYHDYHGRNVNYYQDCRRSSGTTGLLAGGAGGAILGSALGGGTLGTVLGAVGGGLLGKHIDERHDAAQNYRNGC